MSQPNRCPQCGSPLPLDAPPGICPRCILALGFQPQFKVQGSKFKVDEAKPPRNSEPGSLNPELAQRGSRFVPPKPHELAPLFPQLDILDLLGHGGMGAVYKARQTKLDRLVALKILPPEVGQEHSFADRFTREAKTLGQLAHPGIVGIHDFGQAGNLYYLIMEYVDGSNLRQVIEAGALAPEQALAIVPQVCEALQYAHDEGVVHRDIKPENILLDKKGRAKIADFGLAKLLLRPAGSFTLTDTQQVMGTPHYMAPEQLTSTHGVDHRADIYSLGVVFYEMLTGELPLGRFDPPSKKSGVDARLDEVVLRTLERTPERRYQQAGQVKTDVESISRVGHQQPTLMYVPSPALSTEEADKLAEARFLVKGPAIGMMVVGVLAWVQALAYVLYGFFWSGQRPDRFFWDWDFIALPYMAMLSPLYGGVMIAAGWQMLRLRTYTLGVLAGVMAYIMPLGILPLIALPVAIWMHVVLWKQSVIDAFRIRLRQRIAELRLKGMHSARPVWMASLSTASGGMLKQAWASALRIDAGIFVLSLAGVASLLMPWYQFALEPKPTIPPLPSLGNAAILGLSLWQGLLVAAICAAFSVAWLAFGRNAGRLGGILALIAGLIVAAASIQFCLSPSLTTNAVPSWDFALQAYWGIKSAPQYELITRGPHVGPFVAIVSGFGLMLLGALRIGTAAALDSKATTTFPWSDLGFGLCLLLPTLALIGFALVWTESALTLGALAVPWFGMGCWGAATSRTPKESAANAAFVVTFLASLGLIAGAVGIGNSALPLLAVLVCGVAMIAGVGLAYLAQEDEKREGTAEKEKEQENEPDDEEDEDDEDDEEETAENALASPATWMAIVGGIGCWWLLSDGGTLLQKVMEGKDVPARWDLLALAGAPVVLLGGLMARAFRWYWLVLFASLLCLPLGLVADDFLVRVVPFGIGIWMLMLLARPDIRSAFWESEADGEQAPAKASAQLGPDGWPIAPAMPAVEPVAKRPRGTLGRAWDAWWGERDRWFTYLVQTVLAILAVGCLLMYLNFHLASEATPGDAARRHTTIKIGFPDAWFHYEAYPEPLVPFRWRINYFSWSSLVMLAGCVFWYVYWQIERAKPEAKWLWLGSANTIILFWGLLSACVAMGTLLANLP